MFGSKGQNDVTRYETEAFGWNSGCSRVEPECDVNLLIVLVSVWQELIGLGVHAIMLSRLVHGFRKLHG